MMQKRVRLVACSLLCLGVFGQAVFGQAKVSDVESAYNKLKEAEARKDPDGVKEWAGKTSVAARQVVASKQPAGGDELEGWKKDVDYARQVDIYTEYSLQMIGNSGVAPDKVIALTEALETQNPKSQYLGLIFNRYLASLDQTGQKEKLLSAAERRLPNDPGNENLLLVLADGYMGRQDAAKAVQYANQLIEVLRTKAAAEGVAAADWEKRKSALAARGYWIAGVNYGAGNQFAESDKALRLALPLIQGQNELLGPAYFYLGVASYNMAKPTKDKKLAAEAVKFSELCSAIAGPYQEQAKKNSVSIRREFQLK